MFPSGPGRGSEAQLSDPLWLGYVFPRRQKHGRNESGRETRHHSFEGDLVNQRWRHRVLCRTFHPSGLSTSRRTTRTNRRNWFWGDCFLSLAKYGSSTFPAWIRTGWRNCGVTFNPTVLTSRKEMILNKAGATGTTTFSFGQDLTFEAFVQFTEYIGRRIPWVTFYRIILGFVKAMDAFRGMKLLFKADNGSAFTSNVKVVHVYLTPVSPWTGSLSGGFRPNEASEWTKDSQARTGTESPGNTGERERREN